MKLFKLPVSVIIYMDIFLSMFRIQYVNFDNAGLGVIKFCDFKGLLKNCSLNCYDVDQFNRRINLRTDHL